MLRIFIERLEFSLHESWENYTSSQTDRNPATIFYGCLKMIQQGYYNYPCLQSRSLIINVKKIGFSWRSTAHRPNNRSPFTIIPLVFQCKYAQKYILHTNLIHFRPHFFIFSEFEFEYEYLILDSAIISQAVSTKSVQPVAR